MIRRRTHPLPREDLYGILSALVMVDMACDIVIRIAEAYSLLLFVFIYIYKNVAMGAIFSLLYLPLLKLFFTTECYFVLKCSL